MTATDRYGYGSVAAIYDELASFYSRGRIGETKRLSTSVLRPGDRVLYAGVGRGVEAVAAARLGATVVGIDVSEAMLARLRAALGEADREAVLEQGDVANHRPAMPYDVVVANYFLNLFDAAGAREMIGRLGETIRPGGLLVISDFARPVGGFLGRCASELYYRPINWIAWGLGLCALHPILDYRALLDPSAFEVVSERRLPILFGSNPAFVSIVAKRIVG